MTTTRIARELRVFFDHVAALSFADRPDYAALRTLMRELKSSTMFRSDRHVKPYCIQENAKKCRSEGDGNWIGTGADLNIFTKPLGGGLQLCSKARHIPVG